MNRILPLIGLVLLVGCAAKGPSAQGHKPMEARHYESMGASALAFSPPVGPEYPLLGLDRSAREAGAFIGYQESTAEYFSIGIADHQSTDPTQETYDRYSSSERIGVRYR